MLKGIDPLLRGELLHHLSNMGHGEQLAIVDRNFASYRYGCPVVDLGEVGAARVAQAICSVFPLDQFADQPASRMAYDDDPSQTNEAHAGVLAAVHGQMPGIEFEVVNRPDFYSRMEGVSLIVNTLESAPYACFILQKGVILD